MAGETIAIFEGLELTADEARRAIRAHAGADIIWEWHDSKDDTVERADSVAMQPNAAYHAGVTAPRGGKAPRQVVRRGAAPCDALAELLWDVVLDAMLAEDVPPPSMGDARGKEHDGAANVPSTRRVPAARVRRPSEGPAPASCR